MAQQQQPNKTLSSYAGIGFQLIGIALILIYAGKALDEYFNLEAVFLLIAIFIAVFAVIYILIKKLK